MVAVAATVVALAEVAQAVAAARASSSNADKPLTAGSI
jgi:hypothetical protein